MVKKYKYLLLTLGIVLFDQASKLLVHHYMYLHEEINVIGDWFRLHYLLNPGMAFGLRWESEFGKLALSMFRLGATFGIGYYLVRMINQEAHPGFLWCLGLILGGAIGNVIDSTFYGVWLNNHLVDASTPWFHGQVIDMLYFPLFEFTWANWIPFVGGERFLFFSPVFNVADSAIFIGVMVILVMQKAYFKDKVEKEKDPEPAADKSEEVITETSLRGNDEQLTGEKGEN